MDIYALYKPGVRLYFDAEKIANDGLLTRDGAHLKVNNKLPFEKYLIWATSLDTIDLNCKEVTPRKFANESDRLFQEKFGIQLA